MLKNTQLLLTALVAVFLYGCMAEGNNPGLEYAPQMYHSVPYDPLSQITEEGIPSGPISSQYYITNSTPFNDYDGKKAINMRKPVEGTIPRQNYASIANSSTYSANQDLLIYELHKDSIGAAALLENPVPKTDDVLADGKKLYMSYCSHCHGKEGDGKGKVGGVYGGVANLKGRAVASKSSGHVFHVITHGINRMWPHKSQLNPEERWKIVHYVEQMQGK